MSDSSEGEGSQRDPREHQGAIPKRPVKVEATSKSERPKRQAAIKAMSKLTTTTNTERPASKSKENVTAKKINTSAHSTQQAPVEKKLVKAKKAEAQPHNTEVERILRNAELEPLLQPFHDLYDELVNWNLGDPNTPWLADQILFKSTKSISGVLRKERKIRKFQFWLAHRCTLSERLKEVCIKKNPNVQPRDVVFMPRKLSSVVEKDSEEDSSCETDTEETPLFYADFDPKYENLEPIIRIQGSDRATSGSEVKFNLRRTNKENQAGSSSSEMGSKLLPGLPPPTHGKKKKGQGRPEDLLPFPADGQFSDMHDPTLPDRLLRKALEIRKNQGAAEEQKDTEGPGSTNQAASSSGSAQGQLSKETSNNPAAGAAKKERKEKPIEANKMKGSRARTKHGDDYWRPGNSLTSSFPSDVVNIEDLFGFIVLILKVCWSNNIFHLFLDILRFGRDRLATTAFLKKSSKLSMSEMKEFLNDASRPGRSSFLTNKQASIWATICRKIVQAVVPPGEISIVGNLFSYTGIPSITPSMVLRILKFQTILREYIYAENNKTCKHLNKLYQGDVGVPFDDFQRTVTTGELPVRNLDYPCPKCKSSIKMRIHFNKEGFFVLAEGYGEAINRGNIYTKFPKNVVIQNIRYELRAVLAYVSDFEDVGANAEVLIPEIIDEHYWDVVDDGTHVKGKANAKFFTAAAMLATYVFKEEV